MSHLTGKEHATYVQTLFTRIAGNYDRMNRILTAGQDRRWRGWMLDRLSLPSPARVLDLGSGTGDLAAELSCREPGTTVVPGDYTLQMMRQGMLYPERRPFPWTNLDALDLPFPGGSFHAVLSAYLLRNVSDRPRAWLEQVRVLKPGGCALCLDTTVPPRGLWHAPVRFYLKFVIPFLGRLLTGDREAYTYLPESTVGFLSAEQLASTMEAAGFKRVGFRRFAFGTMAIHWGYKDATLSL